MVPAQTIAHEAQNPHTAQVKIQTHTLRIAGECFIYLFHCVQVIRRYIT